MTNTETALLRVIVANPDEDTPWLVYADYLDESGEPSRAARAEFIRLHVYTDRLPFHHPDRKAAGPRIDQLLSAWGAVWRDEMPQGYKALASQRRGFADRGILTASQAGETDDPRAHLLEYLELVPDVPARRLHEIVKRPVFARVETLVVRGDRLLGWAGAYALAGGSYPLLEHLDLARQEIGDVGLRALCESPGFPRLRGVDLRNNNITDASAAVLSGSGFLVKVRGLDLSENPISRELLVRIRSGRYGS